MIPSLRVPMVPLTRETLNRVQLDRGGKVCVCYWYSSDIVWLLGKPTICPLIWPVLLLHIIFSTANVEGGGQSSMSLTKSHPKITLLLKDYGDCMIKKNNKSLTHSRP